MPFEVRDVYYLVVAGSIVFSGVSIFFTNMIIRKRAKNFRIPYDMVHHDVKSYLIEVFILIVGFLASAFLVALPELITVVKFEWTIPITFMAIGVCCVVAWNLLPIPQNTKRREIPDRLIWAAIIICILAILATFFVRRIHSNGLLPLIPLGVLIGIAVAGLIIKLKSYSPATPILKFILWFRVVIVANIAFVVFLLVLVLIASEGEISHAVAIDGAFRFVCYVYPFLLIIAYITYIEAKMSNRVEQHGDHSVQLATFGTIIKKTYLVTMRHSESTWILLRCSEDKDEEGNVILKVGTGEILPKDLEGLTLSQKFYKDIIYISDN